MTIEKNQAKSGFKLAAAATLFTFVVIILGAFTRLVDAGLGCPDWPACYGHILWPMTDAEVATANAAFPDTPVEHDKTWPEQVHRLLATSLGLFCIGIVVLVLRNRLKDSSYSPFKLTLLILAMVILQGMFGRWTVTLNLWPQVVTAHLMGGFMTASLLWLLTLRLYNQHWQVEFTAFQKLQSIKPLLIISMFFVVLQIFLGGWTSSNYAALACPDLPMCQGQWVPDMNFYKGFNFTQQIGPNYLGGLMESDARTAIHYTHRIGAVIVTILVLCLVYRLSVINSKPVKSWTYGLFIVLLLQLSLGISNIIWALPLGIAVAHNAVGALLLLTFVGLCHRIYTVRLISD